MGINIVVDSEKKIDGLAVQDSFNVRFLNYILHTYIQKVGLIKSVIFFILLMR
jgi:hypothetical protein